MSGTVQIDQLPSASVVAADDALPIQQAADGVTRQVTPAQILSAAGGATVTQLVAEATTRASADRSNANAAASAQQAAAAAQATANAAISAVQIGNQIIPLGFYSANPTIVIL